MGNKNLDVVVFVSGGLVQSVFCTQGVNVSVEVIDLDFSDPDDKEDMQRRLEKFEEIKGVINLCY